MANKSKTYKQRFRDCWLKEDKYKEWLMAILGDPFKAFCKFCKCSIEAKKANIDKHATCSKHMECVRRKGFQQPAITDVMPRAMPSPVQQAEATLALFVAEHCTMNPTDHLGEACKRIFQDGR